jgi:hypothetical protein
MELGRDDIDGGDREVGVARKRPPPGPPPVRPDEFAGPKSFKDIFEFANVLVEKFLQEDTLPGSRPRLASEMHQKRIVLTSSYSGIGSAEWAVHFVKHALAKVAGIEIEVLFWSACDRDAVCRNVLKNHKQHPLHIFTDLRDRIPPQAYEDLEGLYTQHRQRLDDGQYATIVEKQAACRIIGDEFFEAACTLLDNSDLKVTQARCTICNAQCPLVPPLQEHDIWIEVGGNTCTPWSVNGKREGWLDYNGLPSLAWTFWCKGARPHFILNECTPRWPGETVWKRIMGQDYDTTSFLAHRAFHIALRVLDFTFNARE